MSSARKKRIDKSFARKLQAGKARNQQARKFAPVQYVRSVSLEMFMNMQKNVKAIFQMRLRGKK